MPEIGEPPQGIPRWLWFACHDLQSRMEEIDGEAMSAGQCEQSEEAFSYEWCRGVAELIWSHRKAEENSTKRTA